METGNSPEPEAPERPRAADAGAVMMADMISAIVIANENAGRMQVLVGTLIKRIRSLEQTIGALASYGEVLVSASEILSDAAQNGKRLSAGDVAVAVTAAADEIFDEAAADDADDDEEEEEEVEEEEQP